MQQPSMFCHDGSTIFYPTAPGHVYSIGIAALADCSGSDEDLADSTEVAGLCGVVQAGDRLFVITSLSCPDTWPRVYHVDGGDISGPPDLAATRDDFHDAIMGAVEVAA